MLSSPSSTLYHTLILLRPPFVPTIPSSSRLLPLLVLPSPFRPSSRAKVKCNGKFPCDRCFAQSLRCQLLTFDMTHPPSPPCPPLPPSLPLPRLPLLGHADSSSSSSTIGITDRDGTCGDFDDRPTAAATSARQVMGDGRPEVEEDEVTPETPFMELAFSRNDPTCHANTFLTAFHKLHAEGKIERHRVIGRLRLWENWSVATGRDVTYSIASTIAHTLNITPAELALPVSLLHSPPPSVLQAEAIAQISRLATASQALRAARLFKRSDDGSRAFALGVIDPQNGSKIWAGNQAYCSWVEEASKEFQSHILARHTIQILSHLALISPDDRQVFAEATAAVSFSPIEGQTPIRLLLKWCLGDGEARLYLLSFQQVLLRERNGGDDGNGGIEKQRRWGIAAKEDSEKENKGAEGEEEGERRMEGFLVYIEPCPVSRHVTDRPHTKYLKRVQAFRKAERSLLLPLPLPKLSTSFFPPPLPSSLASSIASAVPSSIAPFPSVLLPPSSRPRQQQQQNQEQQHGQHGQQQQQQQQQRREKDAGNSGREDGNGKNNETLVNIGQESRGGEEGGVKRRRTGEGERAADDAADIAAIFETVNVAGNASGIAGAKAAAAAAATGGKKGGSDEARGELWLGATRVASLASKRSQKEDREEKEGKEEGEEEEKDEKQLLPGEYQQRSQPGLEMLVPALAMLPLFISNPSHIRRKEGLREKDGGEDLEHEVEEGGKRGRGAEEEKANVVDDIFNLSKSPAQLPPWLPLPQWQTKSHDTLLPSSPLDASFSSSPSLSPPSVTPLSPPALPSLPSPSLSFSLPPWSEPAVSCHPPSSSTSSVPSSSTSSTPSSLAAHASFMPFPLSLHGLLPPLTSLLSRGEGEGGAGGDGGRRKHEKADGRETTEEGKGRKGGGGKGREGRARAEGGEENPVAGRGVEVEGGGEGERGEGDASNLPVLDEETLKTLFDCLFD